MEIWCLSFETELYTSPSRLSVNVPKNRYRNVSAADHTRVTLTDATPLVSSLLGLTSNNTCMMITVLMPVILYAGRGVRLHQCQLPEWI